MGKDTKKYAKEQADEKVDEAQKEAYKKDAEAFNKELGELMVKYNVAIIGTPHFAQMENGAFAVNCSTQIIRVNHKKSTDLVKG